MRARSPQQLCELIVAKIQGFVENSDIIKPHTSSPALSSVALELLELMEREEKVEEKGLVEIMQSFRPNETSFFPKLIYSGSPLGMKSRIF